ncbi:RHS repeat domain-containing protein, partial [Dickeya fangzhongdai]|uniref:RHS repeat domain-containing protein n=1 Tax=Dickeya fangzhongdai TaxID=1778540 RepID=UPI001667F3EE
RVSLPDGARWRYRYDAFGRRVSKVREGQVPSAQAVARVAYRWDGDQLSGQTQYRVDGSVARAVQWVYEPGSFRPLAQVEEQEGETLLHYIVTDLTGTARELCSETGDVHWRGEQGLWGAYREDKRPIPLRRYLGDAANEEVYCELRYQGQVYDAETGLYYNRHRYYDPELGQYISADPIGLAGGLRPQGYVPNPFCWVDPLGLTKCPEKWDVGSYEDLRNSVKGKNLELDAHHVGQKAIMKDLVKDYDPKTAPSMLVPKEGHTLSKEGVGIVSRSKINPTTGQPFSSARDVIARDIKELRRVYPDVPNAKLRELIDLNKSMYPEVRYKNFGR